MRVLSFLLSFAIFSQSLGITSHDLAQLDEFMEHAQFHSEQYGDDIFAFISKHYGEEKAEHEKEHQEEKKEHEELPFQHHCHLGSLVIFLSPPFQAQVRPLVFQEMKMDLFYYTPLHSSSHPLALFEPPRYL